MRPNQESPREIKIDWPAVALFVTIMLIIGILVMLSEVHLITVLSTD